MTDPFVRRCTDFARDVLAPVYATYDEENRFPDEVHVAARQARLIDQDFPSRLGGGDLDDVSACLGAEALAAVCAPCAFTLGFNRGALHPVLFGGTPEQQERFIGGTVRGQSYAALALTESEQSGSNVMQAETTATRTDAGWVIEGTKCMVGNGRVASLYLVLARTIEDGRSRGLTFFAVPRGPGVEVSANTDKLGFRAVETPAVRFSGVEIGDTHRVGAVGSGAALLMETLSFIRVGGASVICGLVKGALSDALPWVSSREVYGGVLAQKSHVQLRLGALYGRLLGVRELVHRAAQLRRDGAPYATEASLAKLHASQLALDATSEVSQMFGWRGIDGAYPIQKRFRDARQTPIFEGTSEVQQLNLFRVMQARHQGPGGL